MEILWLISSIKVKGKNMITLKSCFTEESEVVILIESDTDIVVHV